MPEKIITDIPVRFRDIDPMVHVNNAVFFTYFEEGRKTFDLVYEIVNRDDESIVYASGYFVQICYDDNKNATVTMPHCFSIRSWAMRQEKIREADAVPTLPAVFSLAVTGR